MILHALLGGDRGAGEERTAEFDLDIRPVTPDAIPAEPAARDIVLGTIESFFLREDALTESGHIDQDVLDIIGRVGGAAYATTRDRFRP